MRFCGAFRYGAIVVVVVLVVVVLEVVVEGTPVGTESVSIS